MLQPNEFKIYNASAGAGKTYTLVKEYLSILLANPNPYAFESILAITFTNKAANEMKERILQQLIHFSQPNFAENKDLNQWSLELNLHPEEIHQRSRKILVNILHNYSRFSVSTIDKFNLRLMKSFAQDLGLSVNFNVEMEQEKLFEESVHQLFAKIGEDELLTSVLIEIALDNLNENKSWDISRELVKNASALYFDSHMVQLAKLQKYNLKEFNEFRKTVFRNVAQTKSELIKIGETALNSMASNGISPDDFPYGNSGFIGFFAHLKNERFDFPGSRHESYKQISDEAKFSSAKASAQAKITIPEIVPTLFQLSNDAIVLLKKLALWEGIQKTIVSMSIINEVEKSIEKIKEDQNILLISEFNKRISSSLQNQPSGFIYERIGNRFHHYFIDEFQDTSTLQWQNLKPLVENARAGSDTVMLVGDPKQSIYRWRGGNPEQMLELIEKKEEWAISVENLPTNWRSHENIITFNNEFYQRISEGLTVETYKTLYLEGNNQLTNAKKGGYVQLNFISKKEDSIENYTYKEAVLNQLLIQIQSIKEQGFQWDEIAILHRTKAQGKWIAEFLTEQQIPILSSESLLVKNSNEIKVLELFFKTISNPEDKVSKAQFLLLFHQMKNRIFDDITLTIQSILHQNLYALKDLLEEFGFDIRFAFEPSVSLYDFVEKAIKQLDLGGKTDAYLQYFLDYVLEYSTQNEYNFQRFLEHWDTQKEKLSISSPEGVNAIQLMTIHTSKGLEFPVVILPFADWGDRTMASKFWIPIQEEELPFDEFIVQSFGNLENVNDEIKAIIDREKNEILLDNLNLLYVATTRAIEQLYILTQKDAKSGVGKYFSDQFSGEDEVVIKGEKTRISTLKKEKSATEKIPFIAENWENRIEISRESSKRWKKKKEILYGEWVHGLMQFIYSEKDIKPTLEKLLISGEITQNEIPNLEKRILEIVQHPTLKHYFTLDSQVLNERDFVDENGKIFRPDRIIIKDGICTIIDYKTGGAKPEHISQLNYYAENLEKSGYEIEQKFLVYFGDEIDLKKI